MPVIYDAEAEGFAISPEECPECEAPLYDTGCDAPGCIGRSCVECGSGCDIEADPDSGTCATALAEESDEDRDSRADTERAAFGLPPLTP